MICADFVLDLYLHYIISGKEIYATRVLIPMAEDELEVNVNFNSCMCDLFSTQNTPYLHTAVTLRISPVGTWLEASH